MIEDNLVRPGVPGFLLHERFDRCRQFRIVDQWRRLIDGLDESPLPFGQYQVQRIPKVCGEWVIGDPVHRRVRPVKADFAPMCRVAVVVHFEVFDFGHDFSSQTPD